MKKKKTYFPFTTSAATASRGCVSSVYTESSLQNTCVKSTPDEKVFNITQIRVIMSGTAHLDNGKSYSGGFKLTVTI